MPNLHTPLHARTVALAALIQSVRLVDEISRKGNCDAEDFHSLMHSLFASKGESPLHIYGDLHNLRVGLQLTRQLLNGEETERAKPLMAYAAGLMALEKKLAKRTEMLARIGEGLNRAERQADYFGSVTHENVIASIAALYGETISTLKPRIIVRGKQEFLRQTANTNRVRALLLAGIRAAHLWHTHGGSHLTLLLRRKSLLRECMALQETMTGP